MSFFHAGRNGFGMVDGETVLAIADSRWPSLRAAMAEATLEQIAEAARSAGRAIPLGEVAYLPPITDPEKIICVGLNYATHAGEAKMEVPDSPSLFVRFPSSQVGHEQDVVKPKISDEFDFEGELAVVIGKSARHLSEDQALGCVAGYTIFGEHSVRDWQFHSRQATPGKNFWRSGAIGPWMVGADEIPDPSKLHLVTRLNGETMQDDTTDHLIFSIPQLIAYISDFTELLPGDIISTGTPAGVGFARDPKVYLKPGDEVEVEIEGIGLLRNRVAAEE
ncbi:MAG: fumarylacetoacetate hydrolase family protein [Rhodovibrionaceae bacterium]